MAVIYPGQEFEITYGDNQKLRVKALTGRQQEEALAPLFAELIKAEVAADVVGLIRAAKELLFFIAGEERGKQLWETTVDARIVGEMARQMLQRGRLDDDEEKKSESPL